VKADVGWCERAEPQLESALAARLSGDLDRAEQTAERAEMQREGGEESCLADLIEAERVIIAREGGQRSSSTGVNRSSSAQSASRSPPISRRTEPNSDACSDSADPASPALIHRSKIPARPAGILVASIRRNESVINSRGSPQLHRTRRRQSVVPNRPLETFEPDPLTKRPRPGLPIRLRGVLGRISLNALH
jgi:hypothetical protein